MKLVVLDGYTLNPGDLSWDSFHAVSQCQVFDRTAQEDLLTRAHDATALLNKTPDGQPKNIVS
jgi:glycerate dehydrogenase